MPSGSLASFFTAVTEVDELANSFPPRHRIATSPIARAIGRAATVLLSSHFERYFYSINEEACTFVATTCALRGDRLAEPLRLVHTKGAMDIIAETKWDGRSTQYTDFIREEAWLWSVGANGHLRPERILAWMKAPKPESLIRFYKYWGIDNIFSSITRTQLTRGRFFLLVQELVDKRNNIAHGDLAAEAEKSDVLRYLSTVRAFCARGPCIRSPSRADNPSSPPLVVERQTLMSNWRLTHRVY